MRRISYAAQVVVCFRLGDWEWPRQKRASKGPWAGFELSDGGAAVALLSLIVAGILTAGLLLADVIGLKSSVSELKESDKRIESSIGAVKKSSASLMSTVQGLTESVQKLEASQQKLEVSDARTQVVLAVLCVLQLASLVAVETAMRRERGGGGSGPS